MITETPIEVITNGYDVSEKIDFEMDSTFSISHIGSLIKRTKSRGFMESAC